MKSFELLLKKRVKNNTKLSFDIHTLRQTTEVVVHDMFGEVGNKYIKVRDWKKGILFLSISKSVWRNEVMLLRNKLTFEINKKTKQKIIKFIKINK
ncbi:hypothetical protein HN784_02185 [bacterium]|jgi:hypothetical protein|nr:hypothetical protein [bacterium]MBT4597823.1 hypothetical protein [bacterium]MBT6754376.1 hypothetical protein [bacterium]MBT7431628.1 hypothetical protein [bacterium]MBT7992326.1 hypothetical protein [bacterium]